MMEKSKNHQDQACHQDVDEYHAEKRTPSALHSFFILRHVIGYADGMLLPIDLRLIADIALVSARVCTDVPLTACRAGVAYRPFCGSG